MNNRVIIESIKKKSEFRKSLDTILGPYYKRKFGTRSFTIRPVYPSTKYKVQ
jgi:hypothetical protein